MIGPFHHRARLWPGPLALLTLLMLTACGAAERRPMDTVPQVDLPRFMGDWYVIANIPTFIEKGAHNAVEGYQMVPQRWE